MELNKKSQLPTMYPMKSTNPVLQKKYKINAKDFACG